MLCKSENRDPAHCLKEGRRVTRCAQDLYVPTLLSVSAPSLTWSTTLRHFGYSTSSAHWLFAVNSITKLRENCLAEFEKHWNCLEYNNQACSVHSVRVGRYADPGLCTTRNTTIAGRTSAS